MKIILTNGVEPETGAMLQAFYSRSHTSILDRLTTLQEKQQSIKKSLERYYIGYGHDSIGDCATITLYFENVSMLAAKAIQAHRLYNGQESSTRFISFANATCVNPVALLARHNATRVTNAMVGSVNVSSVERETPQILSPLACQVATIQQRWLDFYRTNHELVVKHLRHRYRDHAHEVDFESAVAALAFDVLRGFLPAGLTTQLSWTGSLRTIKDHLVWMAFWPCREVSNLAISTLDLLRTQFPSSFGDATTRLASVDNYYSELAIDTNVGYYQNPTVGVGNRVLVTSYSTSLSGAVPWDVVNLRTRGQPLPPTVASGASWHVNFLLDWGSYRDYQRHRSVTTNFPLVATSHGFSNRYVEAMPDPHAAHEFVIGQLADIGCLDLSPFALQYVLPLGMQVPVHTRGNLGSFLYVAELRSQPTVHYTLRTIAQQFGAMISRVVPQLATYVDYSTDGLCLRRGTQTIVEKNL